MVMTYNYISFLFEKTFHIRHYEEFSAASKWSHSSTDASLLPAQFKCFCLGQSFEDQKNCTGSVNTWSPFFIYFTITNTSSQTCHLSTTFKSGSPHHSVSCKFCLNYIKKVLWIRSVFHSLASTINLAFFFKGITRINPSWKLLTVPLCSINQKQHSAWISNSVPTHTYSIANSVCEYLI